MNTGKRKTVIAVVGLMAIMVLPLLNSSSAQSQDIGKNKYAICFDPLSSGPLQEKPVVGISQSSDPGLPAPAKLNAELTTEQVDDLTRLAVQRAKGLAEVIQPGDWVVIKPNIVVAAEIANQFFGSDEFKKGTATDLRVIKSLIEQLIEEGDASRITVAEGKCWPNTSQMGKGEPDGWNSSWSYYGGLSYDQMIKDLNASTAIKIDYIDLDYYATSPYTKDLPVPGGGLSQDSYTIPNAILDCDRLIGVAVMKTHILTKVTLLHKLYMGISPAEVYKKYDFDHFLIPHGEYKPHKFRWDHTVDRSLIDLASYHPFDFGIIECIWGMEGAGPIWGPSIKKNLIIAGKDPVAVDAVGAYAMGFNPWDIEYLHLSRNKGFGKTLDVKQIAINGPGVDEIRHEFVKPFSNKRYRIPGRGNRTWLLNGPHYGDDIKHDYLEAEPDISPVAGAITAGKTWTIFQDYTDYMDLLQYYKDPAFCFTYAFTRIVAQRPIKNTHLRFGSVDGIKIWLNGKNIYTNDDTGDFAWQEEDIPINLVKGENRLLVKIKNTTADRGLDTGYGFSMYVSEEDGDTPLGIKYSILPANSQGKSRGEF
ncbi:DUF362 domain-containing protein [Candidatus Omnitrophota bacterium]